MKQMLIRAPQEEIEKDFASGPDFTIFNAGEFVADKNLPDIKTQNTVNVNFTSKEQVCWRFFLFKIKIFSDKDVKKGFSV